MERETFDIVREGTDLIDILEEYALINENVDGYKNKKVAFVDFSESYGSSFGQKQINEKTIKNTNNFNLRLHKKQKHEEKFENIFESLPVCLNEKSKAVECECIW